MKVFTIFKGLKIKNILKIFFALVFASGCSSAIEISSYNTDEVKESKTTTKEKEVIYKPYLGFYLSSLSAAKVGDFFEAKNLALMSLKTKPDDVFLLDHALKMSLYSGSIEKSFEIGAQIEAISREISGPSLHPAIAIEIRRGDLDSAKEISNFLGIENYNLFLSTVLKSWYYASLNQKAASLSSLDQLSQSWEEDFQEAAIALKIQSLLISSFLNDEIETKSRYNYLVKNISKIPPRFIIPLAIVIYKNDEKNSENEIVLNYLPFNYDKQKSLDLIFNYKIINPLTSISSAFFESGLIKAKTEGIIQSLPLFWTSLFLDPSNIQTRLMLSSIFSGINQKHHALDLLEGDFTNSAAWAIVNFEKSFLYEELKLFETAKKTLIDTSQSASFKKMSLLLYANLNRRQKNLEEAMLLYDELLSLQKPPLDVYYYRALTIVLMEDWEKAIVALDLLLEKMPDSPEVQNFVGYTFIDLNIRLNEGIELIKKAVNSDKKNGFFLDSLGWAHFKPNKIDKAIPLLERSVELEPQEAEITDHLGDAYWKNGRVKEARVLWKRALGLNGSEKININLKMKLEHGL